MVGRMILNTSRPHARQITGQTTAPMPTVHSVPVLRQISAEGANKLELLNLDAA